MKELIDYVADVSEMTGTELEFLCGLIRKYEPEKLVEIGVAAGGTSIVVLDELQKVSPHARMWSLDIAKDYYSDVSKKTGYMIEKYRAEQTVSVEHCLVTGDYAPKSLEKIGRDIDFLILDTVHSLPGEMLDFLAFLPFLKKGAVVVLHDIILNHLSENNNRFATQVLIDSVVAEKLTPITVGGGYPGIGAFRVTDDTFKYIEDVFNAFLITWTYFPSDTEIDLYRHVYQNFYTEKLIYIFDEAVRLNRYTYERARMKKELRVDKYILLHRYLLSFKDKNVYIYGHGVFGKKIEQLLLEYGVNVKGFVVTNTEKDAPDVRDINEFKKINLEEQDVILVGTNYDKQEEIIDTLIQNGIGQYEIPAGELMEILI